MDGWLIGVSAPADERTDGGEGEPRFFAAWIADEAAALGAVRTAAGTGEAHAVEPLADTALRTFGAAPGGVVAVPTPSG